ncbi:MAG TPA: hypothetical protein VFQ35_15655 [Polyangiaceae bacterium]|nr:hypothetical protein [Polyangiaceae bacterium]
MRALFCSLALAATACLAPPAASERATDAARSLNVAARFGRMDVALGLTSDAVRKTFLEHRASWGKDLRVLDVELVGFEMAASDRAKVEVEYAWSRLNESLLRSTRVTQEWRDAGGGFRLVREKRSSGDLGLFGEALPAQVEPSPRRDAQFATKVIQ